MPNEKDCAARMAQSLRHRGPDARGLRSWPEATLLHTRLSIIDLTATGAQPMANENGTVWTIFNGEIYNHRELRSYLEDRGHTFKGHSDTEVLVHLFEEEGAMFVRKLRGMFALAIYDMRSKTLLLARDRFGIKPLFFAASNDYLAFASEIGTLRELPGIDDRPDAQAIHDFAALHYIPAPMTFYVGIRALQPGEVLEAWIDQDRLMWKTQAYHRWSVSPDLTMTLPEAADRAASLISAAVCRQMQSDVPLGALLSGGIDSSLLTVAAQRASRDPLRTFNVRFPDTAYDETWSAVAVAKHIGSEHNTLDMNQDRGTWESVTALLRQAGQPFADTSLFAANAVCRMMRQFVTVALSGDGGDEGFGGYNLYWRIARIAQWQRVPKAIRQGLSAGIHPLVHLGVLPKEVPSRFQELIGADDTSIVQRAFCALSEQEHKDLCWDTNQLPVRRWFERQWDWRFQPHASRVERLSSLASEANVRLALPNDFLFKVDMASMRESLEVRVPMLDEDLFEFGISLPHRLKVSRRTCKRVLRAVAKRQLPPAISSKPKQGFGIPMDLWVDADFKQELRQVLLGPSSCLPDLFRPATFRLIVEAFCDGRPCPGLSREGLYQRAIMLLSVQLALARS